MSQNNHTEEDTLKVLCRAPFDDAYQIYCKHCLLMTTVTDDNFAYNLNKELVKIGWTFKDLYIEDRKRMEKWQLPK